MYLRIIGVVGAGTMGMGIAQLFAQNGFRVILWDEQPDVLAKAVQQLGQSWSKLFEKNKVDTSPDELLARIIPARTIEDFGSVTVAVFEAVIERMDVKQDVFQNLSVVVKEDTLLASNTSTMSITEIALKARLPERIVGTHYFNPVPVMKLVEVVRGAATSDETLDSMEQLLISVGKTPVRVEKGVPGFIVNRILIAQMAEAMDLVEKRISTVEQIDVAVTAGLRYPMGPFRLMDFSGVDVVYRSMQYMYEESGDLKWKPPLLLKEKYLQGHWGEKSGKGFYQYPAKEDIR